MLYHWFTRVFRAGRNPEEDMGLFRRGRGVWDLYKGGWVDGYGGMAVIV